MFVVAKMNFFDNELTQELKGYPSLGMAYVYEATYVDKVLDKEDPEFITIDYIKQLYFDCDMMINILELT